MNKKYSKLITVGYSDGKRIRKRIRYNTEAELYRLVAEAKSKIADSRNPSGVTFSAYANKWFMVNKPRWSPSTELFYFNTLKKMDPLKFCKLRDITKSDCQMVIQENWEKPRTCEKIKTALKQIFDAAIEDGIITVNPAKKLMLPKNEKAEKRALTDNEIEAVRRFNINPKKNLAVHLMYYLGLRPEELRALMVNDFNFETNEVAINKAVAHVNNQAIMSPTKNHKVRTLPLPDILIPELKEYISELSTLYLFTTDSGQLMSKTSWSRFTNSVFTEINRLLGGNAHLDLLNGFTWYTFRHNHGTRLYYSNLLTTKMKAYLMGHSEQVFLTTYSHLQREKENTDFLKKLAL